MAYTREWSTQDSQPIELYKFAGTYKTYLYTPGDQNITVGAETYVAIPMERSSIQALVYNDNVAKLDIKLPPLCDLIVDYGYHDTPPELVLTLTRYHRGDNPATQGAAIWKGRMASVTIEEDVATITVPSSFGAALDCVIPSFASQGTCGYVLFDERCGVSRAENMVETTATEVDGRTVVVDSLGAFDASDFLGGELRKVSTQEGRMIVATSGTTFSVTYPFSSLEADDTIQITRGCDHAYLGHCKNRYANQQHFGGCPYIPGLNPFMSGV